MGGEPYYYFVPYQKDVTAALSKLRRHEFEHGRYNPVMDFPADCMPPGPDAPAPGRQHESIEAAFEASGENGTRSILDIASVSDQPDFGVATKLPDETLARLYGTARPTRAQVEASDMDFLDDIERGHAIYLVLYEGDTPSEILFAGYSYD